MSVIRKINYHRGTYLVSIPPSLMAYLGWALGDYVIYRVVNEGQILVERVDTKEGQVSPKKISEDVKPKTEQ